MKTVTLDQTTLNVFDYGAGLPLLLVHGFPLNHSMWNAQLEALGDSHRVIAPDLRGFGASGVAEGKVTMEQLADDCHALLDELGVGEPVVFCGLSMGGYVAWQFVRKYAQRVRALVLCDTRATADTPEAASMRRTMAQHALATGNQAVVRAMLPKLFSAATFNRRPHLVEAVRQMIEQTSPQTIAAAQHGMAERADASDLLPRIAVPTLLFVGHQDVISPPAEMQTIAEAIPRAELLVVPEAGHMAPMENPEVVNAALADFLASVRST